MKRQKTRIQLSEHERTRLERIKSKHTTPQNEAKRAHIILLADEGVAYQEIARRLMITKQPPAKAGGFDRGREGY